MNGSSGDGGDANAASDRPHEPEEEPLPGEDNPGERLIAKYDPTVDDEPAPGPTPDVEPGDVPQDTARVFWYLVAVFNVALMALAVGILFVLIRGRWSLGGQLAFAGVVLFAYGYYRYRKYTRSADPEGADDPNG